MRFNERRDRKAQDLQEGDILTQYGEVVDRVISAGMHHVEVHFKSGYGTPLEALRWVEVAS